LRVERRRDHGGLEPKSKRERSKRERPDYTEPKIRLRRTDDCAGTRPNKPRSQINADADGRNNERYVLMNARK
jgi:hypothetical protein